MNSNVLERETENNIQIIPPYSYINYNHFHELKCMYGISMNFFESLELSMN